MLYNKYRPTELSDVVGQDSAVNTIQAALDSNTLAHSILISGTHGTGKTTLARIIAKMSGSEPFDIMEIDAASFNSVADARQLINTTRVRPQTSPIKTYIIDEVHMYSSSAFNVLLKLLEEPPSYCRFILCTTELHKIIPTIKSRCMSLILHNINEENITKQLIMICDLESIPYDVNGLNLIAHSAEGSMRNALSNLEICKFDSTEMGVENSLGVIGYSKLIRLFEALADASMNDIILSLNSINKQFDTRVAVNAISEFIRDLFYFKSPETMALLTMSEERQVVMSNLYRKLTTSFIFIALDIVNLCNSDINTSNRALGLLLEVELLKLAMRRKQWLDKIK